MKLKILTIAAAALMMLTAAGCSESGESGSSTYDNTDKSEAVGADEKSDISFIDSLAAGEEFVDGFVNFEENYKPYFEDEDIVSYTINGEKKHNIEIDKSVSIDGKKATLPLPYGDACKALGLTYDDETDIDGYLGQGATVGRSMKTEKGQNVRIALYAEELVSTDKSQMVGIGLYDLGAEDAVEFTVLGGISNKTSVKAVIDKLGLPSYVSVAKADQAYEIELQYANSGQNGYVSLIFSSDCGRIQTLVVEIEK